MFDRVGLRTNVRKIVSMVHRPFQAVGNQSEVVYRRRIKGDGAHLQGSPEGTGPVWRMQGGDVSGICGGSQNDSVWASGTGATELENLGHGGRAADLSNGLPGQGRNA